MQVFKPGWLASSSPVNSIDVQPGSLRFATGGPSGVFVWLVAPILTPALEACAGAKDPLFIGRLHEGDVTTVRWSPTGDVLASAGEDRAIILWRLKKSSVVHASLDSPTAEHWAPAVMLKEGHTLEITTLAWHPSGEFIASGGKDTRVCVWAATTTGGRTARTVTKPLQVLTEHLSFVEGVAWDPFGGSLTSFGHDGELLVWEAEGFLAAAASAALESASADTAAAGAAVVAVPDAPRRRFKHAPSERSHFERAPPELGLVSELRGGCFEAGHEVLSLRMDWSPAGDALAACKGLAAGEGALASCALCSRAASAALAPSRLLQEQLAPRLRCSRAPCRWPSPSTSWGTARP